MTDKKPEDLFATAEFAAGLRTRREVLGADYVDTSLANADGFMAIFQKITTEWCWDFVWNRPGLDRHARSIINIAMLTALGKSAELALHIKGALANDVTVQEIQEVLVQATIYCGIPAGLDAFKTAHKVLVAEGAISGTPA